MMLQDDLIISELRKNKNKKKNNPKPAFNRLKKIFTHLSDFIATSTLAFKSYIHLLDI